MQSALFILIMTVILFVPSAYANEKSILMTLFRGETAVEAAFRARLAELGITARLTIVDANNDRAQMVTKLREMESEIVGGKYVAVYSHGTPVTQVTTGVVQGRIPIIFNVVFDPVAANFARSLDAPGGTMTGVTNGVPVAHQLDAFYRLRPFKSFAVFFDARAANANAIQAQAQQWARTRGVEVHTRRMVTGTPAIDEALAEIKSGGLVVDAIYAGQDSYLATLSEQIAKAVGDKILLFGGTQTFVRSGWLATYSSGVADMGIAAAEQMAKLLNGANPAEMPVILPKPRLYVSRAVAARFGIELPAEAEAMP